MDEGEIEGYLLKPMNCPHHIRIYASQPRSYRDLPLRLAEFGTVYRWEQSGEISGRSSSRIHFKTMLICLSLRTKLQRKSSVALSWFR